MKQRRRLYLSKEDRATVERDLKLSLGDAKHAMEALDKNDTKKLRQCFSLLASRANYSFLNYDKLKLTPVTPKEAALLEQLGFKREGDEHDYLDFERVVNGFGETQDDRIERVTYSVVGNQWYGSIRHVDEDGNDWYEASIKERPTLKRIIEEIWEERKRAPKQKATA